ncbi:MAG: flavodoxin family protein [Bacillota bacterium]|nr:flavodoxin family protein [Bacillota bacterium]
MSKHVFVLQGSSRADGNSVDLANAFIEGCKAGGHTVVMPPINGKDISGCLACDICRRNGGFCNIHDYMYELYREFQLCEVIAIVTPMYFFMLPAQIKAIIDRLYCFGPDYPKKEVILMCTSFSDEPNVFSPLLDYHDHLVNYLGWEEKGRILVQGLSHKGDIKMRPEYQQAYELGKSL